MTLAAFIVFGVALMSIALLFGVKRYELAHGRLVGGSYREGLDEFALRVKWVLLVIEWYLSRLPLFVTLSVRWGIRMSALSFARVARTSAEYAHQLADFVSHKRNFERRETKSTFLKEVGEYKNGNDPVETKM